MWRWTQNVARGLTPTGGSANARAGKCDTVRQLLDDGADFVSLQETGITADRTPVIDDCLGNHSFLFTSEPSTLVGGFPSFVNLTYWTVA